jgi:hypothetical protein
MSATSKEIPAAAAHDTMLEVIREWIDAHPECRICDVFDAFPAVKLDRVIEICDELAALKRIIYLPK